MDRAPLKSAGLLLSAALGACAWSQPRILQDPLRQQAEFFSQGKYPLVVEQLSRQEIQKLPRRYRARAYDLLGQSYARMDNADLALGVYQLAEGLFPKDLNILTGLADLLHRIGLDERALPYYQRILAIHPNNSGANRGMAEITHSSGLLSDSSRHYEKALKEQDQDPTLWRDYAEVLAERQDFQKAAEAIQRSLNLSRDVDSLLDFALFERRQGAREKAYRVLQEAARLAPGRGDLLNREALWRLEDGELAEAFKLAARVLDKSPQDPLARWVRASVELRRGRLESAKSDLTAIAGQHGQPFAARMASAMLKELQ